MSATEGPSIHKEKAPAFEASEKSCRFNDFMYRFIENMYKSKKIGCMLNQKACRFNEKVCRVNNFLCKFKEKIHKSKKIGCRINEKFCEVNNFLCKFTSGSFREAQNSTEKLPVNSRAETLQATSPLNAGYRVT